MTVNTELLDATFSEISENPAGWNQNNWELCFAARTVKTAAAQGVSVDPLARNADQAQRLLGLDMYQAERLFFAKTDLLEVGQVISWIKGEFPLEELQPTMDMHMTDPSWIAESPFQPAVLRHIAQRQVREQEEARELVSA